LNSSHHEKKVSVFYLFVLLFLTSIAQQVQSLPFAIEVVEQVNIFLQSAEKNISLKINIKT